jgi:pimeloyl-ACP methyl ester carboxylesterase
LPTKTAAVVFVHGFTGRADETWGRFPEFLAAEPALRNWGVFSLGYATTLRADVPNIWAADPPLDRLGLSLRTALSVPPLSQYRSLAVVAHSMGGLIAQAAVLEQATLARVGHLILFGTPSAGLAKSAVLSAIKRQFRNMGNESDFVRRLRRDWKARFRDQLPFQLLVVAGESDEFVSPASSLDPFPLNVRRVVPGNHLELPPRIGACRSSLTR